MDTLATRLDRLDPPVLDYEAWTELSEGDIRLEVVDGRAVVMEAPVGPHQVAAMRLARALATTVPDGHEVVTAPLDWVLRREPLLVREPDVVVATYDQLRGPRLVTPPLLAAEVISSGNRETDLVTKRREYAEAGLPWYWVVDHERPEVAVFVNRRGRFELVASAIGQGQLSVPAPFPVTLRPTDLIL